MTIFEIIVVIILALGFLTTCGWFAFTICKTKLENKRVSYLSHRELWLYYMDHPELKGLLANNNGKDVTLKPEELSENQYRFLTLFLNHMEYIYELTAFDMLPSKISFEKDWVALFKNECLKFVYQNTKSYREKNFCKLIDKIIDNQNK